MPTPHKTTSNMRKHLTKAERRTRERAENQLKRKTRIVIRKPDWLGEEALAVFEATKKRMRGLNLLDNVDVDLLAIYSDAVVHYQKTEDIKDKQAWSRIVLSYAEKLGISKAARARLAKKKAEEIPPDDMDLLLSDVNDFVNKDV